jgi:hypothetical protein
LAAWFAPKKPKRPSRSRNMNSEQAVPAVFDETK